MYSVDSPNSLWHLDGHHKLIRWKLVTHGAIDGKTRTIVFLKCSSNNRADTVLHQLQLAVEQFGLPSRVRTDKGGENIEVWRYMLHMHGTQTAVVAGSSTHNERIERLWHDMYRCVCCHYYERFYSLEEEQALDPLNETDLYCLHYVFVPRINRHLEDFVESWNNHSLSTEHNQTPYQLMLIGMDNQMPAQFQSLKCRLWITSRCQCISTLLSMCKWHALHCKNVRVVFTPSLVISVASHKHPVGIRKFLLYSDH